MANNSHSSVLLECVKCGRRYAQIKNAMRTCGAVTRRTSIASSAWGVVCGGELKAVEKQQRPAGEK